MTHHKKIKYVWINTEQNRKKEFLSRKFYCNKDKRIKMFSMPYFLIGIEARFYQIDNKTFIVKSNYGETRFTILGGGNIEPI